jgi:CRISPR-associated endonuclease Cas2
VLAEKGKKRVLKFDLDKIEIKKPPRWDGFWRIIAFDIPEDKNKARKALASKMKNLGFYPMQKSVFVYPYDCKNEIDFITEIFEVKPYVRYIIAKDIDVALDLKQRFKLS